jgi:hypothetical protein
MHLKYFDSASGISYRTSQSSCQQERRALSVTLENVSVREGGRRIAWRKQIRGCDLTSFLYSAPEMAVFLKLKMAFSVTYLIIALRTF